MRELAKPLAFTVRSLKRLRKDSLKNQSTYLGAFLALLYPFLAHFGEESEDFLLRSVTVSISDSWDSGGREADEEAGGSDDEEQGFPVTIAGEVGFRVQAARE